MGEKSTQINIPLQNIDQREQSPWPLYHTDEELAKGDSRAKAIEDKLYDKADRYGVRERYDKYQQKIGELLTDERVRASIEYDVAAVLNRREVTDPTTHVDDSPRPAESRLAEWLAVPRITEAVKPISITNPDYDPAAPKGTPEASKTLYRTPDQQLPNPQEMTPHQHRQQQEATRRLEKHLYQQVDSENTEATMGAGTGLGVTARFRTYKHRQALKKDAARRYAAGEIDALQYDVLKHQADLAKATIASPAERREVRKERRSAHGLIKDSVQAQERRMRQAELDQLGVSSRQSIDDLHAVALEIDAVRDQHIPIKEEILRRKHGASYSPRTQRIAERLAEKIAAQDEAERLRAEATVPVAPTVVERPKTDRDYMRMYEEREARGRAIQEAERHALLAEQNKQRRIYEITSNPANANYFNPDWLVVLDKEIKTKMDEHSREYLDNHGTSLDPDEYARDRERLAASIIESHVGPNATDELIQAIDEVRGKVVGHWSNGGRGKSRR